MAIIPKKNKSNAMADTGAVEILLVLVSAYLLIDKTLGKYIHSSLQVVLMVITGFAGFYLFMPNDKCKGKNGYTRILNFIRYEIYKLGFWLAKNTYEQEKEGDKNA